MATQFVRLPIVDGQYVQVADSPLVANRYYGGDARGCVVEWFDNLPDNTVLHGTDGSHLTVAELRDWQGRKA